MPISTSIVGRNTQRPVTASRVQQSATLVDLWSPDATWQSPGYAALSNVAAGNLIVTAGGWWDAVHGAGGAQSLPSGSNGTVLAGANPNLASGASGYPCHSQIGYIANCNAGTHQITPQFLGAEGDGYFIITEFTAPGSTWSKVDDGSAISESGTAGAVDGVTVSTTLALAQPGDLIIAACCTDGDPSAIGAGPATGYTDMLTTSTTTNNIGLGVGWKIATVVGQQSATWAWADNDCKIAAATIAVFRRS